MTHRRLQVWQTTPNYFGCRHCYRLIYESCSEADLVSETIGRISSLTMAGTASDFSAQVEGAENQRYLSGHLLDRVWIGPTVTRGVTTEQET
jgi:hypothetical protein